MMTEFQFYTELYPGVKKQMKTKPICKLRKMVLNQELGSGLDLKIKETNYDNKL